MCHNLTWPLKQLNLSSQKPWILCAHFTQAYWTLVSHGQTALFLQGVIASTISVHKSDLEVLNS